MEILHGKWVGIFPMMKNGWGVYGLMERNKGAVRRRPRDCCKNRCLYKPKTYYIRRNF